MFYGEYRHSIDSKNRLMVPSRLRDPIDVETDGKGFMLVPGLDGCLLMYTPTQWEATVADFKEQAKSDLAIRNFLRVLNSKVCPAECDKQGRMVLPARLKDEAHLSSNVVITGNNDRIEVWAAEAWQKFAEDNDATYKATAKLLL